MNKFTILLLIITISISCSQKNKSAQIQFKDSTALKSKSLYKPDSIIKDTFPLTNAKRKELIINKWVLNKNVNWFGIACDSSEVRNFQCEDTNQEILVSLDVHADGTYQAEIVSGSNLSRESGTWELQGSSHELDFLILKSHSGNYSWTRDFILQYCFIDHLILRDKLMFNAMYFDPSGIK
jgi:hypothetical protein